MIAADGDAYVICPSREIARAVSADNRVPTYVFEFSHFKSHFCDPAQVYYMVNNFSSHPGWASHGSDVQYIHGTTFVYHHASSTTCVHACDLSYWVGVP